MLPKGVPFDSLIIYIGGWGWTFLIFFPYGESAFFSTQNFLSPAAGATEMLPTGSHLSLFLFYILPQLIFLTSNSLWRIGLFFARDFLY